MKARYCIRFECSHFDDGAPRDVFGYQEFVSDPRFANSSVADHTNTLTGTGIRTLPSFGLESNFRLAPSKRCETPRTPKLPPRDDSVLSGDLITNSSYWFPPKFIGRQGDTGHITCDRIVHPRGAGDRGSLQALGEPACGAHDSALRLDLHRITRWGRPQNSFTAVKTHADPDLAVLVVFDRSVERKSRAASLERVVLRGHPCTKYADDSGVA